LIRLADLVRYLHGELSGDVNIPVEGAASLTDAGPRDISFAAEHKYLEQAKKTKAAAVIAPLDFPSIDKPMIRVSNPRLAWAKVLEIFAPREFIPLGVNPSAHVGEDVTLGMDVSVQAGAYVGDRSVLGARVVIHPGVYVGEEVEIGEDTVIYPNAVIMNRVKIGRRCIIHAGAVIGADGFGFVPTAEGHVKVPHIGTVVIEDDVEIGANSTVDRGTTGITRVGKGTKIDNLVQLGHNVQVGEKCFIVAMSGVAGSAVLEDGVTLAGQTGVAGHITVGAGSVVLSRGLVAASLPPGSVVSGMPARAHPENMRILAEERRLPQLRKSVNTLSKMAEEWRQNQEQFGTDLRHLERKLERMAAELELIKEELRTNMRSLEEQSRDK